jgi:ABC-type polysaccharide/polyol phosphate transport system ATPase subunit
LGIIGRNGAGKSILLKVLLRVTAHTSGEIKMYVRLAFPIDAHLEPEFSLIDEVLAVGDIEFQKKCLGKMGKVTEGGRTELFVSHNMVAVAGLCNQAIILDQGKYLHKEVLSLFSGKYSGIIRPELNWYNDVN